MTPINEIFSIDINSKLDRDLMTLILEKGHSRVPVYYEEPTNIIGLVLIKNLLTIDPEEELPVKSVTIRKIPRVPEMMPLYDILNEFQKGHSHMAVVVRHFDKTEQQITNNNCSDSLRDVKVTIDVEKNPQQDKMLKNKMQLHKRKSLPNANNSNMSTSSRSKKWSQNIYSDILEIDGNSIPKLPEKEEAVGIITMEDVIEELLQEEIFDETDHHFEDS
jgi:metal transporter CNNM